MGPDPGAAGPGQPGARRGRQLRHDPGHSGKRNLLPVWAGAADDRAGAASPTPRRGCIRSRPGSRYGRTHRRRHATSAATASTGSQQRHGTSGPALPVPQFPLLYSDRRRLAPTEERSRQGHSPPRSSRSPAVTALLPRTAPEPRPLRHPRANRSHTDPGTCSSPPLWLCLGTTPPVTRCQHQVGSCLLEHRGPWPRRSHAATSPQGSRSGEATEPEPRGTLARRPR